MVVILTEDMSADEQRRKLDSFLADAASKKQKRKKELLEKLQGNIFQNTTESALEIQEKMRDGWL